MAKWGNTPDKMLAKGEAAKVVWYDLEENNPWPNNLEPTPELLAELEKLGIQFVAYQLPERRKTVRPVCPIISK